MHRGIGFAFQSGPGKLKKGAPTTACRSSRGANYRKNPQCDPPVGCVVQVEVGGAPEPLSVVVQVVLDDGGVLLEMSIHPQQASAATSASAEGSFLG